MCAKKQGSLEDLAVVGVDIGKDVFHLVGFDRSGQVVLRRKIKRFALQETLDALPRCIVGMEACLSAHIISRGLRKLAFEPRIIPAIYVKPFGRVSEVVEIVWRRNLRVNQHPPNRRRQPPGRSRHEAEYRQLVLFATARRRRV